MGADSLNRKKMLFRSEILPNLGRFKEAEAETLKIMIQKSVLKSGNLESWPAAAMHNRHTSMHERFKTKNSKMLTFFRTFLDVDAQAGSMDIEGRLAIKISEWLTLDISDGRVPLRGVKTEARMPWSEGEQGRVTGCHSGGANAPR
jgi:hypothetical protein